VPHALRCALVVVAIAACIEARPARACSPPEAQSVAFRRLGAPAGGVWWVGGIDTRFIVDDVLPLVDEDGNEVRANIVSMGAQGTAAVRVPDVAAGTRFPLEASGVFDNEVFFQNLEPVLVVAAGDAPALDPAPPDAPSIRVEEHEVRVGYSSVATIPWPLCSDGGEWGLWNYQFDERPFLLVDDPGDSVVLDVQLQPLDEEPFADVESANEVLFDARIADTIEIGIDAPPETVDAFSVHARVRRIDDGAVSGVSSVEVAIDDVPPEERLSLACGCGSSSPSATAPFVGSLVALRLVRRRRRA
jgi:uncharacterized protein (TIGR03382 family)